MDRRKQTSLDRRGLACCLPTAALFTVGLLGLIVSPLSAGTCNVPGSHSSIQEAVLDPACTTIDLTSQTYTESVDIARSVTVNGPGGGSAVIEGLISMTGSGTQVALNNLQVQNGCQPDGIRVDESAELTGTNLTVTSDTGLPCPLVSLLFADGFESGDTTAWSSTQ